jgi:hypothetical protein
MIPLEANPKKGKTLAAINNEGTRLIFYKGSDFILQLYEIMTLEARKADPEGAKTMKDGYKQVDTFTLSEELGRNGYDDNKFDDFDSISEVSFIAA